SPATNALRSIPEQKPLPAPVMTPIDRPASASRRSRALAMPVATAALTALGLSGRFIVMTSTRPRGSVSTACSVSVMDGGGRWTSCREQSQFRLAIAPQHRQVDLDAGDVPRPGQDARLGLDRLRDEHAPAQLELRVPPDALQVPGPMLD